MSNKYKNVGVMKVPAEFDYSDILAQGKPHHQKFDDFYRVHPFMSVSKRNCAEIIQSFYDKKQCFLQCFDEKNVLIISA